MTYYIATFKLPYIICLTAVYNH